MNAYTVIINLPETYDTYVCRMMANNLLEAQTRAQHKAQQVFGEGVEDPFEPEAYRVLAVFLGTPELLYVE